MLGEAGFSGLGKGLQLQPHEVGVMEEAGAGDGKAHAAQLGDDAFRALERLRAQAAAEAALLVDDGFEAELHQLIGRDDAS